MKAKIRDEGVSFRDHLQRRLKDPAFRKAFDECDSEIRLAVAIAQAREKAGLTQADLAKRLHTKQTNISRIERGAQNITVGTLEKIARALHRRLDIQFGPAA